MSEKPEVPARARLSPKAREVWCAIRKYVNKSWATRHRHASAMELTLLDAVSDVMDGWKIRDDPEVKELTKRGVIRRIAGSWELTKKGRRLLDPRRHWPQMTIEVAVAKGAADAEQRAWL